MEFFNDYIVNIKNLKNNYSNIKNLIGSKKFCAVVKADAYGLGYEAICRTLQGKADYFAVACIQEALNIRKIDKKTEILILGVVNKQDYLTCSLNNLTITLNSIEEIKYLKDLKIKVHLKLNTGLNRYGIRSILTFKKILKEIERYPNINLTGIYSHFATKEHDEDFIRKQYYKFIQYKNYLSGKSVVCHISNSYATLMNSRFHLDMVRNGFLLYNENEKIGNNPVLSIHSRISHVVDIKVGDTIGYDRTFRANKKMKIAIVPIGYADGLDRKLSNKFSFIVGDKKSPIIGNICMDVCMIDITDIDAKIGDEVIILGKSKNHKITVFDYAKVLETSPYEIMLKFNRKRMNYVLKE